MHFHKFPFPSNFEFVPRLEPGRAFQTRRGRWRFTARASGQDIYHFQVGGKGWEDNDSLARLRFRPGRKAVLEGRESSLHFNEGDCSLQLRAKDGTPLLESLAGRFFGQCGEASIFEFVREKNDQFYGLGEKWTGFEHSGKTTKFWNTDVWGDFAPESYIHGRPPADPAYVSIPYLILKRGNTYLGLLLHNPYATFVSTGFKVSIAGQMDVNPGGGEFAAAVGQAGEEAGPARSVDGLIHLGAEEGQPNLYIIVGPSLSALTRKMQGLVGTTPRPPAWALGYQQCRWGYESEKDLVWLDESFRRHEIPVDGLWLDIDYMRGYRVFTYDPRHFPKPAAAMKRLEKAGRRVVPIIDPGVKMEPGYDVYERGRRERAFCRNPQGGEYVGLVWPGETVFPDFSLPSARRWWSREVADFVRSGIHGAWLDMNDPSTGPADNQEMLFDHGRRKHSSFHNQYALGMAMASREGFLEARPNERTFLLCRSGCTGSNLHTAIWTGDNYSNYHHLKNGIATTLNLALSGIPFNGPDSGGFGGDATPELIRDWFKACFLFPVFRNHSLKHTRQQEPWAFGRPTLQVLRHFIRLRYRLRPYLYQLFLEHEETGEAILRPLFYDFPDTEGLPLGLIDDQFMVGPSLLQAPFLEEGQTSRRIVLPDGQAWFDLFAGRWTKGGRVVVKKADPAGTPLFVRDGSILPLARIAPGAHEFDGNRVDFHCFLSRSGQSAVCRYRSDDGLTFAYREGAVSEWVVTARRAGETLEIQTEERQLGFGKADFRFSTLREIRKVVVNGRPARPCRGEGVPFGSGVFRSWQPG